MIRQRQTILMCAPDYFGVSYVINKWMENQIGKADKALAVQQWNNLRDALTPHADLAFIPPQPNVPDMVFTANAGFVWGDQVIVSRFHSAERKPEEPFFTTWFEHNHFTLVDWPSNISFEGAGDALFDRGQSMIWCAHGFRSDATAFVEIEKRVGRKTVALKLVDPFFYHIDTCLCPLEGGWMMYYPKAFDAESQQKILANVSADKLIAVSAEDAAGFCCNAIDVNKHVFMNAASGDLQNRLRQAGFTPVITPLSEFLKAGGGAKCLSLKLVEA